MSTTAPAVSPKAARSVPPIVTWIAMALLAGIAGFIVYRIISQPSAAGSASSERWFVCAQTRKPFQKHLEIGMNVPVLSPFSGKETGFPAEVCYWTRDGKIKDQPTYVLLNSYIHDASPTFCPDCGRLVVGLNPPPVQGHPPPTREEWEKNHPAP